MSFSGAVKESAYEYGETHNSSRNTCPKCNGYVYKNWILDDQNKIIRHDTSDMVGYGSYCGTMELSCESCHYKMYFWRVLE